MANLHEFFEVGYNGILVSLGGIQGPQGKGRVIRSESTVAVSGEWLLLMSANPKRISAIIQNLSATELLGVYGGDPQANQIYLLPYGTFQIDKEFPWIGEVYISPGGVVPIIVGYNEISVT
jgi:hypothetical protein